MDGVSVGGGGIGVGFAVGGAAQAAASAFEALLAAVDGAAYLSASSTSLPSTRLPFDTTGILSASFTALILVQSARCTPSFLPSPASLVRPCTVRTEAPAASICLASATVSATSSKTRILTNTGTETAAAMARTTEARSSGWLMRYAP